LEEDWWPGQVESDASGGESSGVGVAFGGPESAPQPGGLGRVSAANERAAGGSGGIDRDGAHILARIVYLALKHGMTYVRQSQQEYEAQMKEKQIQALRRKARRLGLEVIEKTSGSVATADAASVQG
jgi:hypothetical protein